MWRNTYKDYKPDSDGIQHRVESGKGIIGAEMHELNGWGESFHRSFEKKKKKTLIRFLMAWLGKSK